jgi:hypothetical protein
VSAEHSPVQEAVVLQFPVDRIRPARPESQGGDDDAPSTVVSLVTRRPVAFLRPVASNAANGSLPPAA